MFRIVRAIMSFPTVRSRYGLATGPVSRGLLPFQIRRRTSLSIFLSPSASSIHTHTHTLSLLPLVTSIARTRPARGSQKPLAARPRIPVPRVALSQLPVSVASPTSRTPFQNAKIAAHSLSLPF
ncbi:hypothetical protein EDB89DRAFT_2000804, partial [Lactarius sanguifluus]